MTNKKTVITWIIVGIVLIGATVFYVTRPLPNGDGDVVACTADAFMCPDGSYVGRTGIKCEFVCPGVGVIQGTSTVDMEEVYPADIYK